MADRSLFLWIAVNYVVATITLDTNVLPGDDVLAVGRQRGDEFRIVTVTARELDGHPIKAALIHLNEPIPETGVWGESLWDEAEWASEEEADLFASILNIISGGSFPHGNSELTPGEQRQLRDAMILEAHVKAGRVVFVTDDRRAFVLHGRRDALQALCKTKICTSAEYVNGQY